MNPTNTTNRKKVIVIVGATGKQGGSVVKYLQKDSNWKLKGICRDANSSRAQELVNQGVEMISCNISDKKSLEEAFKGAYGVFAMTTPENFSGGDHEKEFTDGMNLVEAAVKNNIQHLVFSSLDDVSKVSDGKINVPHFTNKNKVEQFARSTNIPYKTFVYPPFFAENLPGMLFKLSEDKSSASIFCGINSDRKIPVFTVNDMGLVVAEVFKHPNEYNDKKILTAGDYLTMEEMAEICSRVLNIPTRYVVMDAETVGKRLGTELSNMFTYFNEYGYYQEDEEQAVKQARRNFPELMTFEQYVKNEKNLFLK